MSAFQKRMALEVECLYAMAKSENGLSVIVNIDFPNPQRDTQARIELQLRKMRSASQWEVVDCLTGKSIILERPTVIRAGLRPYQTTRKFED